MIEKRDRKVMICYSDAGNGPLAASQALRDAIKLVDSDLPVDVRLIDVLKETTWAGYVSVRAYNKLLSKSLWWNTACLRIFYSSGAIRSGILLKHQADKLTSILQREKPSVLVLTNPWIIGFALEAARKLPADKMPKTVSLVIDIGIEKLPPSWYQKGIDLFIVPTKEAAEQLASLGAPRDSIRILGMPVNPRVLYLAASNSTQDVARSYSRTQQDTPHILVMAGREGTRNTSRIVKELLKLSEKLPMRLTVLCGKNLLLRRKIARYAASLYSAENGVTTRQPAEIQPGHFKAKNDTLLSIEGFVPDVYTCMKEADLLITKPGAMTISEAISLKLPTLVDASPCVMGQEIGNVEYIKSRGLGMIANRLEDVSPLVESFFTDQTFRNRIKTSLSSDTDIQGTIAIARAILSIVGQIDELPKDATPSPNALDNSR